MGEAGDRKVYVIEWGTYEDREVVGVFSTAEKANSYATQRGGDVREWVLDEWDGMGQVEGMGDET